MNEDTIAQSLLYTFMKFNRGLWKQRKTEGRNPSEIMMLTALIRGKETDQTRMDPITVVRKISEYLENGPTTTEQLEGLKASELSGILRVKSPTITPVIRSLEEEGLVERKVDPEDRRVVRIRITEKGQQVLREVHREMMNTMHGLVEFLGEKDTKQLTLLLNRVHEYHEIKREEREECKKKEGSEKPC
ncbi:MarR family transcriptional regulator [Paenibacillus sp. Marseille-Q4541]|uniref:MarR family winged helix-turn-helix transcriptional regulator n=1 Tax=Paenibacillus sp. Marseille-Q4541 TaxID=2831522 RepID=UPI001BAA621B|nr:MarR family transcriptional regulator [Paenibacillus sp. Marseille-Q4541]